MVLSSIVKGRNRTSVIVKYASLLRSNVPLCLKHLWSLDSQVKMTTTKTGVNWLNTFNVELELRSGLFTGCLGFSPEDSPQTCCLILSTRRWYYVQINEDFIPSHHRSHRNKRRSMKPPKY